MEVALMPYGSLLAALEGSHDPRRPQGQRYSLSHLLLFSVLAVLSVLHGCTRLSQVESNQFKELICK
jgi:hypothetical protein